MNYRYIYPLFEDSDIEEASEYIASRIVNRNGTNTVKAVCQDVDGEMEVVDLSEVPYGILDNLVSSLVHNVYGINTPLMANYFKTEDIYLNKYVSHILKYLDFKGYNAQSIVIDMKDLTVKGITIESMKPGFQPLSRWNPSEKWISMEYTDNKIVNLMNPINHCKASILTIEPKNNKYIIDTDFIDMIDKYDFKHSIDDHDGAFHLSINVLPQKSYNPIMKLVQLIHKYF